MLRSGIAVAVAVAGSCCSDLTPSLGTSISCRCSEKKRKEKKRREEKRREKKRKEKKRKEKKRQPCPADTLILAQQDLCQTFNLKNAKIINLCYLKPLGL